LANVLSAAGMPSAAIVGVSIRSV